ncbi:hypothetical protein ACFW35_13355 [Fictibacillus sp. NPDC058756]|uniref:hypothetical protein n=1 Tax=Fictibacillus sp. NPDC058756 TaxID=3346625 RepID=UPI0036CE474D
MREVTEEELKYVEFWENEYLQQIYYLLKLDKQKMLDGFNTKEEIKNDWVAYLGDNTSSFATGSERIFYWLFNQLGKPNSSPVGSDMFFETYNAYIHIDIKTVTLGNIGDFSRNIFVGDNQNSYIGNINVKNKPIRPYKGHLPTFYTKNDGTKKVCLTYFITILYNESNLDIQTIVIMCMPNGLLSKVYGDDIINPGKNPGKIRYAYPKSSMFKLLPDTPKRIKVLLWKKDINLKIEMKMKFIKEIYNEQID